MQQWGNSISTSSSCPCVPITGSAALASIGASCDIEATGSTGLSYAGFFTLITLQEVKALSRCCPLVSSSRWMDEETNALVRCALLLRGVVVVAVAVAVALASDRPVTSPSGPCV